MCYNESSFWWAHSGKPGLSLVGPDLIFSAIQHPVKTAAHAELNLGHVIRSSGCAKEEVVGVTVRGNQKLRAK